MSKIKLLLFILLGLSPLVASNAHADKINLNKEIDLYALSQKFPKCKNEYRDKCYDIRRGKGFSMEGYWRDNRLWDGIYTNTELNEIEFKYFDGIQVNVGNGCSMNFSGWYICGNGDKYKPINGGAFTKDMKHQGQFIYKYASGDVYEGNYKNGFMHGYGKMTWADGGI